MMDTQVLHNDPQVPFVIPVELEASIEKHDRRQFRIEQREGWGATTGGKAIAKRYLCRLSDALAASMEVPQRRDSFEASLFEVLVALDRDVIALCILQTSLHAIAEHADIGSIYRAVGHNLAGECWGAGLTEHSPKLAARIEKQVMLKASPKHRQRSAEKIASALKKHAFKQRDWANDMKARAGAWGVNLMLETLPDVFTVTPAEGYGSNRREFLEISDTAWSVVDEALHSAVVNHPVFFPSVVPPKPWDAWNGCGPTDARVNGVVTFLRTNFRETAAAMRGAIHSGEAKPALDGVNALQGVAWKINRRILDVIEQCAEHGIKVPGLPQWHDLPIPEKLPDAVWAGMDEDRQRFVRMRKAEMHQLNRAAKCDRIMFSEDMKIARDMAERDQFYTPMNCDWRGRVYALTHFNFQREDYVRALFQFRDGEALGETGLYWLKVHVANCGDFNKISKQPMDARVKWVDDNIGQITATATSPLEDTWWTQADKPFLFLAACMELARCVTSAHPESVVTCIPVSFDGSCSGLQHLSAMTRAEEGQLVNLTPSPLPQDIYESVAVLVKEWIELDLEHQPEDPDDEKQVKASARIRELARLTLAHGVTRKLVKRNVMTYAYSSKKFGMASQLQVDLMAPLAREVLEGKREEHPFAPYQDGDTERPGSASRYLADRIFEAIETKVKKPSEAMKFLQKLARAMAHEGKPLRWTTPVGLPWINRYHDPLTKQLKMWLHSGGIRIRKKTTVTIGDHSDINKEKAANGVAPNFVHALDAAHLLLVANAARSEGILQIATVHDSFGCLPSQAGRFRQIIREEFLRMYETNDVLGQVLSQATCDLTHNNRHMLPDAIEYGSLNLKEILNADFAFA